MKMRSTESKKQIVAVVGASSNPYRYSNRAVLELLQNGHEVLPIHPTETDICGLKVKSGVNEISQNVDTFTIYVNPDHLPAIEPYITAIKPARVIFNPGTEHPEIMERFSENGIQVIKSCTLIMLATKQF